MFSAKTASPPLSHRKFADIPFGLDRQSWVPTIQDLKLHNFLRSNPTYMTTKHQRHDRRTDGQTDNMQWQYRAMHICYAYRAVTAVPHMGIYDRITYCREQAICSSSETNFIRRRNN